MKAISKSFPGVRALNNVDLTLHSGEVLALLGENGAGKSTLIKILGGAHTPDEGTVFIDGKQTRMDSPTAAQRAGVGVIYQDFNLVPALTARENIFLGQHSHLLGRTKKSEERRKAESLFKRIGIDVNIESLCRDLPVAQQQIVAIAKVLSLDARIVVMDEPTAALTPREVKGLAAVIDELKSQGIGIIYISHRLDEIEQFADRITVLRDGKHVGGRPIGQITRDEMIELMVGRSLENEFPKAKSQAGDVLLTVKNLSRAPVVQNISFSLHRGEILGFAGLVGAGRTETVRLLFGVDAKESGEIWLDGSKVNITSPAQAIRHGICLLTEDRNSQGLVSGMSVQENFGLANMKWFSKLGFVNSKNEGLAFNNYVDQLTIKVTDGSQIAQTLSGGNQQKVVLAKWLQQNAEVLIFDEPTRGIDVGAKYEIYLLMNELAAQGKAILMISSELPEILGMSDRIIVMHEGKVAGEITDPAEVTQEDVMRLATGSVMATM
ncbi:MAG: D-xylose ABC transporter ATP-binding protein [Planctomycetaceae bacterium]|nr:D-xylose ABC transporter ATP-binding protein [Planctomycetaceae bacterium]MBP63086.1 D-xylose ABC transporter ATP-binding protein [Planctomycetaceae bacterium]